MKEELLKILGSKLTAIEFIQLMDCISKSIRPHFTTEMRIKIQNFAEKVGKEVSGSQFEDYLNQEIAPKLINLYFFYP